MNIIQGDLIQLALQGEFDVIAHGCNCFCRQASGIAKQMVRHFHTNMPHLFDLESKEYIGDINKLGQIQFAQGDVWAGLNGNSSIWDQYHNRLDYQNNPDYEMIRVLTVVNCYTQYRYGDKSHRDYPFINYRALGLCLEKINYLFSDRGVGLPLIGGGLAGGNHEIIIDIMRGTLVNVDATLVILDEKLYNKMYSR